MHMVFKSFNMSKHVHIIGAGIIGLCSAWYLREEGFEVTVIDGGDINNSTSTGNAGMIVPSHFVPLAAPGVIAQGLRWMFNPKSPFYIRPRMHPDLLQWLWQFYRSCTPQHVQNSMHWLRDYNILSRDLYGAFAQKKSFDFCFEKKGLLMLYKTKQQQAEEWKHAEKAIKLKVPVEILNSDQIKQVESSIQTDVLGGVYYPEDAHLYPNLFIQQMCQALETKGVQILRNTQIESIQYSGQKIEAILDQNQQKYTVQNILFCTGSWTARLLKKIKHNVLLQDGKGYSLTLKNQAVRPKIPTILCESKVAVTPMGNDLRIGGTLELSNHSTQINKKRVQGITESLSKYYPELQVEVDNYEKVWQGYRPCTPTGLPYLGKIPQYNNAYIATGHGMMGMSLGPATGLLMKEVICQEKTSLDLDILSQN